MFANRAYVKIWKLEDKGKYYTARMSTSKKVDNGYEQDWSDNFVRLVGTAANQVRSGKLKEGDRAQIENCGVTNQYSKEKNTTYTNYVIFAFTEDNAGNTSTPANPPQRDTSFVNVPKDLDNEELPFN